MQYTVELVEPSGIDSKGSVPGRLPVVFAFPGIGSNELGTRQQWCSCAPVSLLLVTLHKPARHWWFIKGVGNDSWRLGMFDPDMIRGFLEFIRFFMALPDIDDARVGLLGYSAGGYAVAELLAAGGVWFKGVGIAAGHCHGDLGEGLSEEHLEAFKCRLSSHQGAGWIKMIHCETDKLSPWPNAWHLMECLNERQCGLGFPPVVLQLLRASELVSRPNSKRNKHHHQYWYDAFFRDGVFLACLLGYLPSE